MLLKDGVFPIVLNSGDTQIHSNVLSATLIHRHTFYLLDRCCDRL
jgi:hypothetical protein